MQHCPNCGAGELKIIAAILERPVIAKILTRLGLDPQPPPKAPAREPVRHQAGWLSRIRRLLNERWALMHELRGADEPPLETLLGHMQRCDLVLIEGFKNGSFPKLEVWRAEVGKPTLWPEWPEWPGIQAIAGDGAAAPPGLGTTLPWLPLQDSAAIADFVVARAQAW